MSASPQVVRKAHLIGIGGSGMQSLAVVLLADGWRVSGSDLDPAAAAPLCRLDARVHAGHAAANVPADAALAIYSDAVPADNIERLRATELGIRAKSYAEMLAELCQGRRTFAVAGTHGKSTTVAMAAAAMISARLDPQVICGAVPIGSETGTGGRAGSGPMVVEACEYRANFLQLQPDLAVVLGIEPDHFDFYRSPEQLRDAFAAFADRVPADGLLLLNSDCPAARELLPSARCRVATFGLQAGAEWTAGELQEHRGRYSFQLMHRGRPLAGMALKVPGLHNVLNALAAAALAAEAGAPAKAIAAGISEFRGLHRRLEVIGACGARGSREDVAFVDDYAHHPTAVRAGLAAVRRMFPGRRVWCVFQQHQASRTAALLDELAASFHNADRLIVADIYRAREGEPKPGEVTAADLAAAVQKSAAEDAGTTIEVLEEHATDAIQSRLLRELGPGDVLVTMGAGDIGQISQVIIRGLRKDRARS